jgi:hypothetical protein
MYQTKCHCFILLIISYLIRDFIEACSVPIQQYVRFRAVYLIAKPHPAVKRMGFLKLALLTGWTHPGYASLADPLYGFAVKRVRKFFVFPLVPRIEMTTFLSSRNLSLQTNARKILNQY